MSIRYPLPPQICAPRAMAQARPPRCGIGAAAREGRSARVNYVNPGSIVVASFGSALADDSALVATATEARIEASGRISRIDVVNAQLIVGDQIVQLDALSCACDAGSDGRRAALEIGELAAGDIVEIAGPRNSHGNILATLIERVNREGLASFQGRSPAMQRPAMA